MIKSEYTWREETILKMWCRCENNIKMDLKERGCWG